MRLTTLRYAVVAGVTLALLAAGCGGRSQPAEPASTPGEAQSPQTTDPQKTSPAQSTPSTSSTHDGEPVDGDWIISRLPVEPAHLNPLLDTGDAYSARITGYIIEPLLERNNETLELEPVIAESYEVSPDHLTYLFRLRKDVTFSDGKPVTAQDVLFTFDAIRNPANETADLRNYYQDVRTAELLDGYTIRFTCSKPYFRHLEMLGGLPVYPKHIYGSGDFNTHPNNRKPVGSGPYLFGSWETNQQITLVRNEHYWNTAKKPHILKMVNKIITDDDAAFQVLARQELDVMGLTPEQWMHRAIGPEFEAKFTKMTYWAPSGYIGSYSYVAWNLRKPQFADKRVRRALTMLLDRQLILDTIFYGLGKVVTGPAFWDTPEYNKDVPSWPFDPEAAKKLLDEAGWTDTDRDGIRDKNGVRFAYEYMFPANSAEYEAMATVYKEELERAGIKMTIRPLEWATFLENITKRSFDSVTLSWALPVDSDPYQVWHSSQTEQGSNYPGFANAEADKLLEEARVEFDRGKRVKMYWRFHEIVHEEQPYTFLFSTQSRIAMDKRYRNVKVYKQGLDQREWWVPAPLQRYR